ncbi:MAG TPA: BlaI/MecI/CopY family transcriptional regulator [Saprospiraceae bacterium]|nr:BlaI/MecI/CopY family transcriptional regulator [Saprospiraceae bacterium]
MERNIKPTEAEFEILSILWEHGPSSVGQVNEILGKKKEVGYTTTLKMMQIMTDKGLTQRNTTERKHIYEAAISERKVKENMLTRFLNAAFNGSASKLVMQLLDHEHTTKEELDEIRSLIDKLENQ